MIKEVYEVLYSWGDFFLTAEIELYDLVCNQLDNLTHIAFLIILIIIILGLVQTL